MNRVAILSTPRSAYLADMVAQELNLLGSREQLEVGDYKGGEHHYRVGHDDRSYLVGMNVVLVGSMHDDTDLLTIYRTAYMLAANKGVRKLIIASPYMLNTTQEREIRPNEVVCAAADANLLSSVPSAMVGNTLLMLDLHTAGQRHYYGAGIHVNELYGNSILQEAIKELGISQGKIATADLGRTKWAQAYAKELGWGVAFVSKTRAHGTSYAEEIIGDVHGFDLVLYDDMTRSGTSLINAAKLYLKNGASSVCAVLSHLALNDEEAIERLIASPLQKIISTDSHYMSQHPKVAASEKFVIKTISPLLAESIRPLLMV